MSYIEDNVINKNEKIVYTPELNSIRLIVAWIWGVLGFWLLLIPLINAIKVTIYYCTTEFAVTNKKVVEKYGWLNTHCDEMALSRIENITVNQSMFGKLFNYGNVCIQGTNRNNVNFIGVKYAKEIRKIINNQIEHEDDE